MYSLADLERISEYSSPSNPVGKCRLAVDELSNDLGREGIEHDVVEGDFVARHVETGSGSAYHWYIRVDGSKNELVEADEDLILDPTVHQFTEDNYIESSLDAYVGDEGLLATLLTPSDGLYNAYE